MSDSELSDAPSVAIPPDKELEDSLRLETQKAVQVGGDVTVRRVRDASAAALGLPDGFYTNDKWKSISKELIRVEHDKLQNTASTQSQPTGKTESIAQSSKAETKPSKTTKRASLAEKLPPRKKAKPNPSDEDSASVSSELSDITSDHAAEQKPKQSKGSGSRPTPTKRGTKPESESKEIQEDQELASESEMSVVLDDEPVKRKADKNKRAPEKVPPKSKAAKASSNTEEDPDKEEIKKLQGWLVKCGIRKVWGKELKPYETNKAKIKHLRDMLTDVGMTGRFSNEKAAQIKEARELAADIEEVQQGAQRWGKSDDEDDDAGRGGGENRTRGGRRLVRGAKHYDFLSSDGEETD